MQAKRSTHHCCQHLSIAITAMTWPNWPCRGRKCHEQTTACRRKCISCASLFRLTARMKLPMRLYACEAMYTPLLPTPLYRYHCNDMAELATASCRGRKCHEQITTCRSQCICSCKPLPSDHQNEVAHEAVCKRSEEHTIAANTSLSLLPNAILTRLCLHI